ncbi:Protein kinase domain [Dillenia turbinata]|uniref:Protein kinase domain n=1 Tax=Dillenia turbinata TaxID=194707 RepID=A0AAN8VY71_9MAGN
MGCLCSKSCTSEHAEDENDGEKAFKPQSVTPTGSTNKKQDVIVEADGSSVHPRPSKSNGEEGELKKTMIVERPPAAAFQPPIYRFVSMTRNAETDNVNAGWPSWLTSVAAEAVKGWVPRRADSFEKLDKIGQGTYSNVYRARDLETGKIVAMKKVRFVNMDPESVRFMAREISILRRLDHPNVMKLEGLVTSRISSSLYLVFEYMEHDLAGLAARPGIKFSETQIKCYMKQLLCGLEHCHGQGVLHRDIKGSNLLVDNNGVLKIADFGLATCFTPGQNQPLTSRVVTLWYRAPELLLGCTDYGVAVDMWSAGCILAELFAGKPIMPGRTEVEQMHKIFKLCGSPSEDYWKRWKLPHATSFKPQHPYKRRVAETFKDFPSSALALIDALLSLEPEARGSAAAALQSEFFTTNPLPCDPSTLPKYPPSKEFDAKHRDEEARPKKKAEAVKGRGPESVRRGLRESSKPTSEYINQEQGLEQQSNPKSASHNKFNPAQVVVDQTSWRGKQNAFSKSSSVVHPSAVGSTWDTKAKEDASGVPPPSLGSANAPISAKFRRQTSHLPQADEHTASAKEHSAGYAPKKNRIHYSGPLMPPGGNLDDMLKEHERQIQQAVRKARLDKARSKKETDWNC